METLGYHFYSGPVVVMDPLHDQQEYQRSLPEVERRLETATVSGLDFEWTPDLGIPISDLNEENPGNPIALVQIALQDWVLVYRHFQEFPLPVCIRKFLEESTAHKYVIHFDLCDKLKLKTTFGLEIMHGLQDIVLLARNANLPCNSMKALTFNRGWHMRKSKRIAMSEWGCRSNTLTDSQISYAAEDAWFTLLLGLSFSEAQDNSMHLHLQFSSTLGKRKREEWSDIKTEDERKMYLLHNDVFEVNNNQVKMRNIVHRNKELDSVDSVISILTAYPVGHFLTDRVILASLLGLDPLAPMPSESKATLNSLANENAHLIDLSYDGDRRLGLYRLRDHPRRSTAVNVRAKLDQLLVDLEEKDFLEIDDESFRYVAENSEEEKRTILSIISRAKIACDRSKGVEVDAKVYKKQTLNSWVRDLRKNLDI